MAGNQPTASQHPTEVQRMRRYTALDKYSTATVHVWHRFAVQLLST